MEYFLDNFQLRKIQLLNLLDSEERFFSINELAEQMNVSNPTVDKTIEAAKSDCKLHRLPIVIERQDTPLRSVAIQRRFNGDSQVLSLRKIYIIESLNYRLLKDFFFEHFSDVKTFAQEQFTSHSLIYNKLGQLKEMLAQFDLALDLGQHFHLVGDERQIRFLFVSLFWNTYNDFDWPLQSHKEQFNP
ncbi:MAG: HTH domain-containing protein, partial [Enterococcus sp.]|nr:HTH domain-containing protein [Enterococcus sp.]